MLIGAIHTTDLFWAILSSLGAVYPLYLLIPAHREPGAKELIGLIVVLATYPWATATFHLTPFDNGLVLAICLLGIPAYLSIVLRTANLYSRALTVCHIWTYTIAILLAGMALTNPWHGYYANFAPHLPGQPNHAISYGGTGIGMSLTYVFEFLTVGATLIITGINYSRTRWKRIHILASFILPGMALGASLLLGGAVLKAIHVNPFFVATAAALWVITYGFARRHQGSVVRVSHAEVIAHMPDAIVIADKNNLIVDFNPAFNRMFGCEDADIAGQPLSDFLPGAPWTVESSVTRESTDGMHLDIKIKSLRGYAGRQDKLLLVHDVTESTNAMRALQSSQSQLNQANNELLRMSNTDPLTGLYNRRFFDERFGEALACVTHTQTFGLLIVDIDHFKRINDTLGHPTGDRVLVQLAQQMQLRCREQDILARIGGEEFAVILPNVDRQTLPDIALRFHQAIQIYVDSVGVVTTSIGGLLAFPGESEASVLGRVDDALYQAKGEGRNRVVVSQAKPRVAAAASA